MSMLYYSLKTEVNLKLQDYKLLLSCFFIAFMVFIATPARSTHMYPMVINEYTGYYNSAFMGLYSAALTSFIFATFGIYLIIGRVSLDYTSGVGQILASTHMKSKNYILTRTFSHVLTLLTVDLVAILTAILVQLFHGESYAFNLTHYLLPHVVFVWPIALLTSCIAVFLELYFRNRLHAVYVGYFFVVTPIISTLMIAGFDLFGFYAFGQYLVDRGLVSTYHSISLLNGGDFTPVFIDFPGIKLSSQILTTTLSVLVATAVFFLASLFRFDRFDPSRWSISLSSMLQKSKKEGTDAQKSDTQDHEPVEVHYSQLPEVSHSTNLWQYLILIRSEFSMVLPRSKLYYATLVIVSIIAIGEGSPGMISFTLFLAIFPLAKIFSKDYNQGPAELLLTMPQGTRKISISRLVAGTGLLVLVNVGLIISYLSQGNLIRLALLALTLGFILSMSYGLTSFFKQDKAFISTFGIWWYLAMNGLPGTDFLFMTIDSALVVLYASFTIAFLLLGLISNFVRQ